jgi:hypothetical protein
MAEAPTEITGWTGVASFLAFVAASLAGWFHRRLNSHRIEQREEMKAVWMKLDGHDKEISTLARASAALATPSDIERMISPLRADIARLTDVLLKDRHS